MGKKLAPKFYCEVVDTAGHIAIQPRFLSTENQIEALKKEARKDMEWCTEKEWKMRIFLRTKRTVLK